MKKIEKCFDINMLLMTLYAALESAREEEHIELVYDIDATVPKELRGDVESVTHVLTQMLIFIFQNTPNHEVIMHLHAPQDFLYEESITFEVSNTGISHEKAMSFFDVRLKPALERLEATTGYEPNSTKVSISIPFKLHDLGNRRYYRLPDIGMLGKKVLLISKSKIVAQSLQKMFRYFLYEVDEGVEAYTSRGSNLAIYDIFILEDSLLTHGIEELVVKVQQTHDLKFVILQDANKAGVFHQDFISAFLVKPVMQESIYELIVALFEADIHDRKIKKDAGRPIIDMEKYIIDAFKKSEEAYLKMAKIKEGSISMPQYKRATDPITAKVDATSKNLPVLNVKLGQEKSRKVGVDYLHALREFVEVFDHSDTYFRDIAQGKAVWQIKEFALDLEKKAALIGAERMTKLAEDISLLFVYENLDMLPVYSGKYHLELKKLLGEIHTYLKNHT